MAGNNDTVRFLLRLMGLQSGDVNDALNNVEDAGLDIMDFARWTSIDSIQRGNDIRAESLEYIVTQSGVYSLSDYISENTFDIEPDIAADVLASVPDYKRGDTWEWLVSMTGAIVPDEDSDTEGES